MSQSVFALWSDPRMASFLRPPATRGPCGLGLTRAALVVAMAGVLAGPVVAQPNQVGTVTDAGLGAGDRFGQAVAIGGGLAVAGAPFEEGGFFDNTGAAYVYREILGVWTADTRFEELPGSAKDDWFGAAVATDGQVVAVGAPKRNTVAIDDGAVYVYRFDQQLGWLPPQKLVAPDAAASDQFGTAIALFGDAMLIGAPGDDGKGSAYVFRYNAQLQAWAFESKLQAAAATVGARFGASLDAVGDLALVGAPLHGSSGASGAVWAFERVGSVWGETGMLLSLNNGSDDQFGTSVAFDGTKALIGAVGDDQLDLGGVNIPNAGAAYVFARSGAVWAEEAMLTAGTEASANANFGFTGDLSGGAAVVGAFQANSTAGQSTGAAYVFRFDGVDWARQSVLVANDTAAGDAFGYDIDGIDTVMIGAPGAEPSGSTQDAFGAAYFFTLGAGPDLDSDADGLTDADETAIHHTNPLNPDTDADGLTDGTEVNISHTDPLNPDTDADGLTDGEEVGTYHTDPLDPDTDGDLLTDGEEVDIAAFGGCPDPLAFDSDFDGLDDGNEHLLGMDPCDADADNDGLADGLELDFFTDPFVPDTDGDGLLDGTEVDMAQGTGCPDPRNPDSDADTLTDGEEATLGTSPCSPDTDGDGVGDAVDDQPTVPGVSSGFIADALRDLAALVAAMPAESFTGPNHNGHHGRRSALKSQLRHLAKDAREAEWEDIHRDITRRLLPRLDGNPRPSDWMVAGPDRDAVYAELVLIDSLVQYQSTVDHDPDHDGHRDHEDRDCDDD